MSENQPPAGGGYGSTPPPPPPPPGQYGVAPAYGQPAKTNSKAIWSLVLGILGLVCCGFFTGIPAIILGKMGQNEVDRSGGAQTGRGMATAGFVIGIIAVAWGIVQGILVATGHYYFHFNTSTNS